MTSLGAPTQTQRPWGWPDKRILKPQPSDSRIQLYYFFCPGFGGVLLVYIPGFLLTWGIISQPPAQKPTIVIILQCVMLVE